MGCYCDDSQPNCGQQPDMMRAFPNNSQNHPCLPRPTDDHVNPQSSGQPMDRLGPWATGRVRWSPDAGLIGIRPVVDRYSVTKYSPKEWRKKNQEALEYSLNTEQLKVDVQRTMESIANEADRRQNTNTALLEEKVKEVRDCQSEIEGLIKDFRNEIVYLTETKIKLKFSLPVLKMPESIAGECIDRRSMRLGPELVNDEAEVELVKELALIKEIRDLYEQVITEIEKQMLANRACKDQLEFSWSDKKETCEWESISACFRNTTPIITYHGGAVRLPENQSTPESWTVFNATLINTAKEELKKSRRLRETSETTVIEPSVRDLRNQAAKVYAALEKRIKETNECREMFEKELQEVLRQIAEAESLYDGLLKVRRQLEYNTKVVETRLDNRMQRPRIENCRDDPQYGLIDETKFLNTSKSELQKQINDVDKVVSKLYETRCNLEYAILTKRKSLYIDRERCMAYRERYPDAVTLSGSTA